MSRNVGTGSFGNGPNVYQQSQSEFDIKARDLLNGKPAFDDSSPRFEDWSPEKQKASYEGLQRADSNLIEQRANADAFLALHPEFIDLNTNGQTMNRTLETMFGDRVYTVAEFEQAYAVCRANNSLQLDQAEIVKQQQAAANQRTKAALKQRADAASRVFNPHADYDSLSLEEIRERANGGLQLAGEQQGANGF
jgi:hypothetical protein